MKDILLLDRSTKDNNFIQHIVALISTTNIIIFFSGENILQEDVKVLKILYV